MSVQSKTVLTTSLMYILLPSATPNHILVGHSKFYNIIKKLLIFMRPTVCGVDLILFAKKARRLSHMFPSSITDPPTENSSIIGKIPYKIFVIKTIITHCSFFFCNPELSLLFSYSNARTLHHYCHCRLFIVCP